MKPLFTIIVLSLALEGCTSKRSAQREAVKAFEAGQQQGIQAAGQSRTTLLVRGSVKNPIVRWTPGMTLSQAILAAEFVSQTDPHRITVTREGTIFPIDVRKLLRGQEDPELRPGDLVDLQ